MQRVIIRFVLNCHTGSLEVHVITRWCKLMQQSSNYTTVIRAAHPCSDCFFCLWATCSVCATDMNWCNAARCECCLPLISNITVFSLFEANFGMECRCTSFPRRWTRQTHELSTLHPPHVSNDWCPTPDLSLSSLFSLFHKLQTHTNCYTCKPLACEHSYTHTLVHTNVHTPPTHRQLGRHSPGSTPWEKHRGRWTGRSCQWGRGDKESASHFK